MKEREGKKKRALQRWRTQKLIYENLLKRKELLAGPGKQLSNWIQNERQRKEEKKNSLVKKKKDKRRGEK